MENLDMKQNGHTEVHRPVAGIFLEKTKEKMTIYQAMKKRLLKPGTALALLEAQAATVGIIDPINNRILPVANAVKEEIVGPEMKEKLLTAEKAISGYVDPYTNQIISVFQAMQKDLIPRDNGLRLLEAQITTQGLIDPIEKTNISVESAIQRGYYEKGLLNDQMSELKIFYNPSSQETLSYQNLLEKCTVEPDTGLLLLPVCITFKGLRRGISSTELFESKVIDQETFDDLRQGKTTTQDVLLMETVKEYLQGKGSISGIALLSSNQRMSIYQAMKQRILMPGTALVLLEAQAATGFMIDPVENKKFTVDEAVKIKLIGPEYHAKLRSAERAVTGYKDPYTGETISLFQAMSKDLIVREHGIRLLEAQIATGGIIDPINSHRLPTDVAFKRGYFNEEMNAILEDSGDDTKGFFDPNTEDNLSYLHLMERCVTDPVTGLCLLPLLEKSDRLNFHFIDYKTKMAFKEVKVKVTCGKYMGMTVSLWELLMSEYFDEQQRTSFCQKYRERTLTIQMIITTVLEVIEKSVKTTKVVFEGIREPVTAKQLQEADIISKEVLEDLTKGKKSVKDMMEDENVNVYLQGKDSIAGIMLPNSQIMTIDQARKKGKLMPGTALILLEAQAATGFIIDPIGNRKFSVDDAVKAKIVGPDICQKLRSAEKAVTGYIDPYNGKIISLFQAMQKDLIVKDHGIRLLEAQIATGGIIDPVNSHRIPVHVAYKRGYFNEEMNQILSDPSDDTKGFFDPNTHENLTYLQLIARCVTDPSTGMCLLPLKGKSNKINIDDNLRETFKTAVTVKYGRFKGKHTTLWDLINSEYLSEDKRQEFFKLFKSRKITIEQLIVTILEIIENKEIKKQAGLNFQSLRGEVSVVDLLELEIVNEQTYNSLIQGQLTSTDVMKMDSVREFLQGKSCVAGVILQPSNQKLSIYEAQRIGVLTPGTALCLLEAQAATGFIVDPQKNQKLTVAQALREKVIGPHMYEKLLSAERAVTGYTDPYTGQKISLFQALQKDLIIKQHGIRLLEAQIATGGIIDPLKCLHLPLEVAYRKGYFDAELNQILIDPTDDTKGFFDPQTQENLTYMEMLGRCFKDKETGLLLLTLSDKPKATGTKTKVLTDTEIKQEFEKTAVKISFGRYSGKLVSLWELLHARFFTEEQRLEFIEKYRTQNITKQTLITMVTSTIEKLEKSETPKMVMGLRKPVSAQQLLNSDIIDAATFKQVNERELAFEAVTQRKSVRGYLKGTRSIAGIKVLPSQKVMSIYEAKTKDLLTPGIALLLLEAQAATGWVIDPIKNKFYSVDEAAREKVIGLDVHEHLLSAERAVTGYKDPYTDATISLFEALNEELIQRNDGIRLLEAQIATGGIIDPNQSHRLPVHVAIKRGYLDEKTSKILSNPTDDAKGFFDPNTKENLSYCQLISQCEEDPESGLLLLPLSEEKSHVFHTDEQIVLTLKNTTITMNAGKYKNKEVTLWEVLISEYISEQKRKQLTQQFKSGALKIEDITEILTVIITEVSSKEKKFRGLRKQVSASELYESKIISKDLFTQIIQGEVTEENVSKMESIQKYLGATNCIAGVRVESTKKVISIYEAKTRGLLPPGTSLVLLEAQAATGFVIDPVNNKKLSVDQAVDQRVVGSEWKNKLLSAERAVTGYKDPYTGDTISLFQALKKDLIVKDHGIRLLEAQIATGGIIDPVHSHRVPVQVAYQRGYFDEEMNQILSDPDDDTKGFFDPNTHENLTYLQLVERCVTDPKTGLNLLVIVKKGEFYFFVDEATKLILKSTTTTRAGGKYQGTTVCLWDLLYSKYITEERRRELVQQYKSGSITLERFMEIILTIIQQQTTTTSCSTIVTCQPPETKVDSSTSKTTVTTTTITESSQLPTFHGIRKDVSANELLESKIITEDLYKSLRSGTVTVTEITKMDSVRKYLEGTNSIAGVYLQSTKETLSIYEAKQRGLLTPGTSLVLLEAQAATGFVIDPLNNKKLSVEEAVDQRVVGSEWGKKLLSAERAVTGYKDPYTGNTISLFQALKKDLIVKDHGIRLLEAQIATGGIIDPVHSHRVPVQVAYQRGYFDEEMNQILSDPDDDTKGFFDPNTQENLTYLQLVERCVTDPITGLSLLVIVKKGEFYFFVDESTKLILKSTTTTRAGGKYQGTTVCLWDLLYSKYITEERRRELVQQYKSGSITLERFMEVILTIIQQQTTTTSCSTIVTCQPPETKVDSSTSKTTVTTTTITESSQLPTFHGIRKDVSANELLESKIITEDLYKSLRSGTVTVTEITEMDSVRKYLEGTNSIAGVYLQSTKETLSIYEAKQRGLLTPGTSLVLLEAQAATGFVIDPLNNKKLSVEEAVDQRVVGSEWGKKLLSAERAVTGYKDPYTGNTISLFQALKKDLIVKDHGIRLLEAQIATGGIIDPVHSHRVPVQVAYQRGYFDEEMNQILSDPDDDTKGFFDPNTQENLTYLQLVERCVTDAITGLSLLVIVKKGEFYFFVDEATKLILKSTTTTRAGGKYQGKTVCLWDLLYSKYITEERRRELVQQYKSGSITLERFMEVILTIIQQQTTTTSCSTIVTCQPPETKVDSSTSKTTVTTTTITESSQLPTFHGIRKDVSANELLESKIITEDLYKSLRSGTVTVTEITEMDSVRKYLEGTNSIAGVYLQSTKETLSIYEAKQRGLLTPGTSLVLLEAQAATGFVIDPLNNKKLSVEEAVDQRVVGSEWGKKLLSAERAVTGYKDPYTGNTISLFQALKKDLIVKDHGIRLLEAQIATGGIIDPVHSHRVPVQVAYQRGYFDEQMNQILSDPDDDTKGFFDPNTQENLTYLQLVERCVTDPITGLSLLVIVKKGEFYFFVDEATKLILKSTTTTRAGGKYQGKTVCLWDLLYSKYITEERRRELVQQYKSGSITLERFMEVILTIIQQQTTTTSCSTIVTCQPPETKVDSSTSKTTVTTTTITESSQLPTFHGIRKDVSANELLESKIITEDLYKSLRSGTVTVTEITEMDSVRKYLEGTNSIAGVYLQSTKETLSIYEAKQRGLLTPGTSLVLLEAQAATGFVIDPLNNKKLSVEEAVDQRVVGSEWGKKLLSAERAVTGYKDPYTGNTISLFQALKKDLIVKDHGIRLLEAQIATGGIIDPVHSHRVPVQVAYQRGYFDEEMNQILSDPDDDTKGFFDPNTQENLTYLQLVERCVTDPITGLSLLVIVKKGEFYFFVDESTKLILKSTTTTRAGGKYQGKTVCLWDLLYSKYITEERRRELVQQYKSGSITLERFMEVILTIIQQQTTTTSCSTIVTCQPPETKVDSSTSKTTVTTTTITESSQLPTFHGIRKDVSANELLESKIITEDLYKSLRSGTVTVTEITEMDSVRKYLEGTNSIAGVYLQSTKETLSIYEAKQRGLLTPGTSLVLLEAQAATGFVIDPLNNKKLSVEEAVDQRVVGSEWGKKLLSAERAVTGYKDPYTGNTISLFQALKKDLIVKDHGIRLLEAQIATGGIIDPVHSHRVPVQVAYQRGYFDEEMNQILSDPDDDTKGFFDPNTQENLTYLQLVERCVTDPITGLSLLVIVKKGEFYFFVDEATKLILKSTTTTRAGGKYQGKTVCLWDLLYSKYITEERRRELVQQYKSGSITLERFMEVILTIIQQQTTTTSCSTIVTCQPPETKVDSSTSKTTVTTTTITESSQLPTFHGIRKDVSANELLESKIITEDLYKSLRSGTVTVTEITEMDSVRKYLEGTNSIAGVYLQSTKETLSIYEAKQRGLLTPGTSLVLLEAQAATGFVIDPLNNKKLSVEEAVDQRVVGSEWGKKLLSAERAVTGYKDPYTGNTISLFQALKKDLIVKDHGIRLLEAQIATGGIIDPVHSHRVPVQVAYQRGYFDEQMNQILSDPDDDTKGFFDPNTQENLTYLQLVERCVTDPITGLSLLVIVKKGEFYFFVDEATKLILKSTTTTRAGGKYQGKTVCLWDLLYSKYITEERRRELVQQYKSGSITLERFMEVILTIIQQQTTTTSCSTIVTCQPPETKVDSSTSKTTVTTTTITESSQLPTFHGIRKDVSANELLESKIITEDLYKSLRSGTVTVTEITEMDSVRKYLEGTNSIAGVYLQSTKETLSIYEAKQRGLLTPGTSLVLLEAQAATGFVIDPLNNKKLSVEEAVDQRVVGSEWGKKLLSAERAVTGYKDPYTGNTISLFQALKKDLIVKDHGIRLLEAQIATGGIIDPVHSHRVPVQVAYQRGYFDEEMNQILSDPDDDTKGFFDPNTQENLTYLQLVERCVTDPITGLSLLVIVKKGEFYFFVDEATKLILKSTTTTRAGGKYQGKTVCLWDLLYSKYITEERRRELVQQYKSGSITLERFMEVILTIIQQQTTTTSCSTIVTCQPPETKVDSSTSKTTVTTTTITESSQLPTFHGIRKDVSANELLESKIITEDLYKSLRSGTVTVTEITEMDSVRKYLEGTNSIAGVYLQSTKETLSIYEAKQRGLLTPGTSLVLLEAQAATGFVIDPLNNKKLSVEEAVDQRVVGSEWGKKLLSAERAVTGYKDPYTGNTISLFQALKKDLIVKDHGIRLLEAQIATGGIIDPVHSHRVPVQVAYQRGYFDEEMNQILSDPDDDTKGFFDPNTQENLTYLQLVERCVTDPITGLSLLVIVKKGEFYFFVDEATKLILKSTTTTRAGGKYQGKTVCLWDLLYSKYITEERRRELVQQYKSGSITLERFMEIILTIIQQQTTTTSCSTIVTCQTPETKVDSSTSKTTVTTTTITESSQLPTFHGIRKDVSANELLESKIITEDLYKSLRSGTVTVTEITEMDSVRKYLEGTNSIAGVYLQSTKETLSIYEAKQRGLLTPGTSLVLLEAQAATGFVIDPLNNKKLSVEEAVDQRVVGSEWGKKLLSAERAVTGYKDPYTGNTISLFQALKKDLIVKDHGIRLLEAQIATGGIIDPVHSHRVPVQVAYQRGYFDEEMNQILSDPDDDTKGFFDPNTQENLTYLQLVERCVTDPITGLSLLVIVKKGEFYFFVDEATKLILKSTTTTRAGGKYQGKTVCLWDLLYSKYITEERRRELVQQYKSGSITLERFMEVILTIIQQQTTTTSCSTIVTCQPPETKVDSSTSKTTVTTTTITESSQLPTFHGIRKDVSANELLESKIITEDLYKSLRSGTVTVTEITEMDSVRKYLEGTNSIAGVYLQSTKETLSIYEAKQRGLLTPGTSLVLLEAQAATGFVIDPLNNKKLSVEEAVDQRVVGSEWGKKLLSAERAVTGYKDPYTGNTISLFQALKKDLIVKDHGIRLLEAQIATGGIIDPVHSHRVPVQVAYQRGYFDEEMNQILSDPDDDTKGFFDPNTQENLTYLQLVERCVTDPITGLSLLVIVKKGEFYFFVDEATKLILKSTTTTRAGGKYQGKTVCLWDLLYSKYITEERRRELVQQYKSGSITLERFMEVILTIIQQQTTTTSCSTIVTCQPPETKVDSSTSKTTVTTTTITESSQLPTFHGIRKDVSANELLESKIITEDLYKSLRSGTVTVTEITEMDSVRKYLEGTNSIAGVYLQSTKETLSIYEAKQRGLLTPGTSLVLLEAQAATGFVIDPLNNKKLSVEEAVDQRVVGSEWGKKLLSAERAVTGYKDPYTGNTISLFQALKKDLIVKDHGIRLLEAQIATGGIIDPVHSHRVPVQVAYQRGYFDEEMNQILSDPDDDTKGFFDPNTQENLTYLQLVERCVTDPITGLSLLVIVKKGEFYFFVDEATKLILKSTTTTRAGGKYQGKTVCLWDLLYSKYITEERRRELVQQYKSGSITLERFMEIILTIIQQQTTTTSCSTIVTCQTPETKVDSSTSKTTVTTTTITESSQLPTFHGIRKDVSANELLESKIITEDLYKSLRSGTVTVTEITEMDSVRKYLEGTNSIAGVYLQSTKETLSIYEAKQRGLLTPGTSLVLLEAQAATGFVIDPLNNKKLSVEEAVDQRVVGSEWGKKLLSAERAVTGYKDPYTGNTISLFQALKKDLIVKDHGIRLLEAQIATGGIIDPIHSHRVPVQVAYQRGYFDEEMNQILSDPDDDTKGFFDPNTQENLTYLQLVERCVTDPITGLSLLVIVKKGEFYFFVDEATKLILKSTTTTRAGGKYQGTTVCLWDLLYSKYITEERRRELVQQYKSGSITLEHFMEVILTIIQQQTTTTSCSTIVTCQPQETKVDSSTSKTTVTTTTITESSQLPSFHGIRKDVSANELLESKIITEDLYKSLRSGTVTVTEITEMDSVRKYLEGTNSIAGVYLQSTKETLSIYEAKQRGLLTPGTSLVLLEAQAATGFVIDPLNNKKLSVEEAVDQRVVGSEWGKKLLSAERAVTGYKDPYTGNTISLFQALKKDLIVKDHGIRLLEAQIATGGIIDPVHSHRVPVQVAYQRGYFDEEMNQILSDPDDDTKGFFDPNTQENLTYLQLVERCVTDPITGLSLLVIVKKGEFYFFVDEATKVILKSTTTTRAGGKYQGKTVCLWDLLYSKYITEERRRELVQQYKSGSITLERFMEITLTIIQQQTTTTSCSTIVTCQPPETKVDSSTSKTTVTTTTITESSQLPSFHGIRKDVSANELLESKIITEDLYKSLRSGTVTVTEITKMDSVRKYLEGTNSIAGVYLQSTKETLSIYEAKQRGLLTPGTSLVLLEAQAATGFVIDPVKNKKLSVEEAVDQRVVGNEWGKKLLSAERAVTGYKDPYTGNTISLFQALKKDLIVKDHGIRLLEAQIATGGIIDPVHSHRVPVQVAYQRGYFDEEMNQILSDADDDTKGFFDPNTHENLTYLQLVERCVTDPITGLSLLPLHR
ncbi:epiplakin [Paralichthys olivaceus]|uniref:epiplakin n=1 Tax=Paralichthys olivaceus TaxID=8255 RepID=UPI003751D465